MHNFSDHLIMRENFVERHLQKVPFLTGALVYFFVASFNDTSFFLLQIKNYDFVSIKEGGSNSNPISSKNAKLAVTSRCHKGQTHPGIWSISQFRRSFLDFIFWRIGRGWTNIQFHFSRNGHYLSCKNLSTQIEWQPWISIGRLNKQQKYIFSFANRKSKIKQM